MQHCTCINRDGSHCRYVATCLYNGKPLCKIHLQRTKGEEDCPICLESLLASGDRICLENCRHFFHRDCLVKAEKSHCPLCKSEMNLAETIKIFGTECFASEIFTCVMQRDRESRMWIFECIALITGLSEIDRMLPKVLCSILGSVRDIYESLPMSPIRVTILSQLLNDIAQRVSRLWQDHVG